MSDRPIIFSAPMVRALLDGRKTQTRRVLKPFEPKPGDGAKPLPKGLIVPHAFDPKAGRFVVEKESYHPPRYAPGDRLWVREAWWTHCSLDTTAPRDLLTVAADHECGSPPPIWFGGDETPRAWGKARPSIHMPRWASRLTLHVEAVRVERLQDISDTDARAEGVALDDSACDHARASCSEIGCFGPGYRGPFAELWWQLHGPCAWDANPWVAAITFRVEHANIDMARGQA